jgi:hypothetical protein
MMDSDVDSRLMMVEGGVKRLPHRGLIAAISGLDTLEIRKIAVLLRNNLMWDGRAKAASNGISE